MKFVAVYAIASRLIALQHDDIHIRPGLKLTLPVRYSAQRRDDDERTAAALLCLQIMERNYLISSVSGKSSRLTKKALAYRLNRLAETHFVRKHTIGVMVPLVRNPICTFNLVLTQCVAIFETVGRCIRNSIGRTFGASGKPQVRIRDFFETVVLLKCNIIFDVQYIFPSAFVVVTSSPFDKKLRMVLS
jgi:hypothetical protein